MNFNQLHYAGFWPRLGSFFLDLIIALPLAKLYSWGNGHYRLFMVYYLIPSTLFWLFYNVYLVRRFGGTPGKLLMKLRILKADGAPIGYREAFLRYIPEGILYFLLTLALVIPLFHLSDAEYQALTAARRHNAVTAMAPFWYQPVSWMNMIWVWGEFVVLLTNPERRALHDFVAGTVVVYAPPKVKPPAIAEAPVSA
ncbi:MAG TPA: RDD family protein [Candidatus Limnocylindria bacterium]|jgi:uncharacterized RDD family membrane protein YckC|nr:RDD family protein [Candidatus Limnocylindria bacterium]